MAADLSYDEILLELESRGVMPLRTPSLEPTRRGLERVGFYEWPFVKRLETEPERCVVVAGTNGKGSVCATLEALCSSAGERVGLYTSPHLVEITERFRIDRRQVTRELFREAYTRVARATADLTLSHFEMLTVMGLWMLASGESVPAVDRLILEVGLGGTWDSTNAVPHGVSVITSLGFDHQAFLGNTLAEIAANKFGIIRAGNIVVHAPLPPEARAPAAAAPPARWVEAVPFESSVRAGVAPEFRIATPWGTVPLNLAGKRGAANTALALTVFRELGFDPAAHLEALTKVDWPGRMERVTDIAAPCPVYLSGDHNPQGVESLLELLPAYPRRHLHVLVGIGQDKDADAMLGALSALENSSLYLTQTPFKGRKIADYGPWVARSHGAWADPHEALRHVLQRAHAGDLVLITGSLYLVGALKRR